MRYRRTLSVLLALGAILLALRQHEGRLHNLYSFVNPVDLLVLY